MMSLSTFILLLTLYLNLQAPGLAEENFFERLQSFNNVSESEYQKLKGNLVQYREGDVVLGVMGFFHYRGEEFPCGVAAELGIQEIETVNFLVDMINKNSSILPNITLGTVMINTCDIDSHAITRIVNTFLPLFSGNQVKNEKIPLFAGFVGASSSGVSLQTASLLQAFKIPQVSPWSTHPELSDKKRFPYFFRTVPPDTYQAAAIVSLLVEQGWNYVSIVYEDDFYGVQGFREVEKRASNHDICLATAIPIPRQPKASFYGDAVKQLLKTKKARVVVIFAKQADAENMIHAANENSDSRGYFQWVGTDGWTNEIPFGNRKDYLESLNGSFGFAHKATKISGLDEFLGNRTVRFSEGANPWSENNRNPWLPEFLAHSANCSIRGITNISDNFCTETDHIHVNSLTVMQNVADAVYAIIFSFDQHVREVCGEGICAEISKTAGSNQLAQSVYEGLKNISFRGINGRKFMFDESYDGPADFDLYQFNSHVSSGRRVGWSRKGQFVNGRFSWNNEMPVEISDITSRCSDPCEEGEAQKNQGSSVCCWTCQPCLDYQYVENGTLCSDCPEGHLPSQHRRTCVKIEVLVAGFSDPLGIASTIFSAFGLLIILFVSVIFFLHRNTAIVKASGKESCCFVLIGASLCFLNTFVLFSYPTAASCSIARLFLSIGPTMMYAAIVTKTIRVLVIFHSKDVLSKQVKIFLLPKYQVLITFLLLFLQLCVVAFWFGLNLARTITIYPDRQTAFLTCSDVEGLFVLVGYAYPFLLIITCTILATMNRKVPTGFNETQYVGFTMYTTCIIWLAFIIVVVANPNNVSLKIATLAISLSLSAATVLGCLFGVRCHTIIFRPNENTSKSVMSSVHVRDGTSQNTRSEIAAREISSQKRPSVYASEQVRSQKRLSVYAIDITNVPTTVVNDKVQNRNTTHIG